MAAHNEFGKRGEEAAARFLEQKGYIILERDWHYGRSKSDLDIIAKTPDEGTIVFVEVKTRQPDEPVDPRLSINRKKIHHLGRNADNYIKFTNATERTRFDVIFVFVDKETDDTTIEHIEDAFNPLLL